MKRKKKAPAETQKAINKIINYIITHLAEIPQASISPNAKHGKAFLECRLYLPLTGESQKGVK